MERIDREEGAEGTGIIGIENTEGGDSIMTTGVVGVEAKDTIEMIGIRGMIARKKGMIEVHGIVIAEGAGVDGTITGIGGVAIERIENMRAGEVGAGTERMGLGVG